MLKSKISILATAALLFSFTAYGADPASEATAQPGQAASIADQLAKNPASVLPAQIQADSLGYLSAVVQNPTDVTVANVFVVVRHFDEQTGQPDRQSNPILVARRLMPGYAASAKIPGVQVYKKAEFDSYKAIVIRAEPVK